MATISYKPRYGKDLIEYNRRQLIDSRLATDWALEEFVLIDGKSIGIEEISKLTDKSYLMISLKIFCQDDTGIEYINGNINYKEWIIKENEIDKNLITYMQTVDKTDYINLLIKVVTKVYDIDVDTLNKMPYNLASYLMQKVIMFLSELTKPCDSFDIEEGNLFRYT